VHTHITFAQPDTQTFKVTNSLTVDNQLKLK